MTLWSDENDAFETTKPREAFIVTISAMTQPYINASSLVKWDFMSIAQRGMPRYMSFAIDMTGVNLRNASLVVGPDCNASQCRNNIPPSFYHQNILTYLSFNETLPSAGSGSVRMHHEGVQIMHLEDMFQYKWKQQKVLYVMVQYRHHHKLNEYNQRSNLSYMLYTLQDYGLANRVQYNSLTKVVKSSGYDSAIDHFDANMYYNPSEVVLYPCRGHPVLLIDHLTPASRPEYSDYQMRLHGAWGVPLAHRFTNDSFLKVKSFVSVVDANSFDFETNKYRRDYSDMSYQLYLGSQAEDNTPGNHGQLTVIQYNSRNGGKVTIRLYPAAQPHQHEDIS